MSDNVAIVSAVWLRRRGSQAQVLIEINGEWRVAIEEHWDGYYSHIAEARGFAGKSLDPVTEPRSSDGG